MDRQTLFLIVIGVCTLNGLFSPFLAIAIPIVAVLMPELFPKNESWVLFFSSIFVSCCTLFFSGVPAALYERLAKPLADDPTSSLIWLALAFLMTVPALRTLGLI
ncbi:MAG TPA: hypothetical protein VLG66_18340 [Alphaproteobacteria bacterium]|jgi:hypothetical protein|nr:hypothetical protein [Alphaproteobacteria bacterium]